MNGFLILPLLTIGLLFVGAAMGWRLIERAFMRRQQILAAKALATTVTAIWIIQQLLIFTNLLYASGDAATRDWLSSLILFVVTVLLLSIIRPLSLIIERERRQGKGLTAMLRLSQALVSATTCDEVLQQSVVVAKELLETDCCSVALLDPRSNQFGVRAGSGWPTPISDAPAFAADGDSQIAYTVAQRQPVVVADYRRETAFKVQPGLLEHGIISGLSVPMLKDERVMGALLVVSCKPRQFNADDIRRLSLIANQIAVAIDKAQLLTETHQRAEALARLNDITRAAIERQDTDTLLQTLADRLNELIGADQCFITLWDDARQQPIYRTASGDLAKVFRAARPDPDKPTLTQLILQTQQSLVMDDAQNDPRSHQQLNAQFNVRSLLGLPLIANDAKLGAALLTFSQPHHFTPEEIAISTQAANQIAQMIGKARLFDEAQRQTAHLAALYDTALATTSVLETHALLERYYEQLRQLLALDTFYVARYDADHDELEIALAIEDGKAVPGFRVPADDGGLTGWVVRHRQPLLVRDLQTDPTPVMGKHITTPARAWLGVPLIIRDRVTGVVSVQSFRPAAFDEEDQRLLEAMAAQIAIAFENARLFEATRRTSAELKAAGEILHGLNAASDFVEAFPSIVAGLKTICNCDRISLGLLDESRQWATSVAVDRPHAELGPGARFAIAETAAGANVLAGRVHFTADLCTELDFPVERMLCAAGYRSRISLPLRVHGQVIGALNLNWRAVAGYDTAQLPLLRQIADAMALVAEKSRLFNEAQRRTAQLETLQRTAKQLTAHLDQETLLQQVLTILEENFGYQSDIFRADQTTRELVLIAGSRAPGQPLLDRNLRLKFGEGISGWVAEHGVPLLVNNTKSDPRYLDDPSMPAYSAMAMPLKSGDDVIGVLFTYRDQPNAYKPEDETLLQTLADQIAIALSNAQLYTEVRQLAITDGLTGLPNHRHIFDLAKREFERARRYGRPLAAIMFDIDHFKQLNDTYGHQVGNEVLRALAERFRSHLHHLHIDQHSEPSSHGALRDIDIIGRYGGEEFAVVLPESDLAGARQVAERMRVSLEARPIQTTRGPLRVTISLGVAEMDADCPDFVTLLDHADAAMYAARAGGRRNVVGG